jgi:hypothetical protein
MTTRRTLEKLIAEIAAGEQGLVATRIVAPRVRGGAVRARVAGLVYAFRAEPADVVGWGLFEAEDAATARLVEEASPALVERYLRLLPRPVRFVLARPLRDRSWLAFPANASDARQRRVGDRPVVVHLVEDASQFELVAARTDGAAWWFEAPDRAADPVLAERLREARAATAAVAEPRIVGLTPEMRTAFELSLPRAEPRRADRRARRRAAPSEPSPPSLPTPERRLGEALRAGGGRLLDVRDGGADVWTVEWSSADGERHVSVVSGRDLTVVSSGICLSGRDRDFDLQSLVGVVERRWED